MLAGGGTRYTHEAVRAWVPIEGFLASLAVLAGDTYGGLRASPAEVRAADDALAGRLKRLRAARPTNTLKLLNLTLTDWRAAVDGYEQTYRAIVAIVGRKADVATVAAHGFISRPLFLDDPR